MVSAASLISPIASGSFITIFGSALSSTTRQWQTSDFGPGGVLPLSLDGVSVQIAGEAAVVEYVSPVQINAIAPADLPPGPASVVVRGPSGVSAPGSVTVAAVAPGLFVFPQYGGRYVAADVQTSEGKIAPAGSLAVDNGANVFVTAHVGDYLMLYGSGWGATKSPAPATLFYGAYPAAGATTVTIGGKPASVQFAGRVSPGLDQINVAIPALPDGDYAVNVAVNGVTAPQNVFVSIGDGVNAEAPGVYNPIAKAANTAVFLGDSISLSNPDYPRDDYPAQATLLSGSQILTIGNVAVHGDTSAQILAMVPNVIALQPAICFILAGTNDLGAVSPSVTVSNINGMVQQLMANHIQPILSLLPPRNGMHSEVAEENQAIGAYATSHGLPLIDFNTPLADPTTGDYKAGLTSDGTHPSPAGAMLMAQAALAATQSLFMPVPSFLPSQATPGANFLADPFFLVDGNGDGLADAFTVTASGAAAFSILTGNDGARWQSVTSVQSDQAQVAQLYIFSGPDTFQPGDRVALVGRAKLSIPDGSGGEGSITVNAVPVAQPLLGVFDKVIGFDDQPFYCEFTVPAGTSFLNVFVTVAGASANIQVSQMGLFNLTKSGAGE